MQQLAIHFPRSRRGDPETSAIAAERVTFADEHAKLILGALAQLGKNGGTYHEIAEITRLDPVAVNRRLSELEEKMVAQRNKTGLTESGRQQYESRPSPTGRPCAVWRVR